MLALDRTSRAALAGAALLAFAGALSNAPTTAHVAMPAAIAVATNREARPTRFVVVVPHRDPFADGIPAAAEPPARPAVAQPPFPAIAPALGPLPPNAGARDGLFPFSPAEHVSAIVTGAHPFALVDDGSTTHLVTVGDRYDNEKIVAIDAGGVHLEGGTTLPASQRPSAQQPTAGGRKP
jgi:hypothetical protein